MDVMRTMVLVLALLAACGCGQDASAPEPSPAEVPEAGPAVLADPGPAPGGQWEPPVDEPADSAADSDVDEPTETNVPSVNDDASGTSAESSGLERRNVDQRVSLKLQSWDETEQLIAAHKGKVVVVDFWATSCLPCRREFPQLVELQQSFDQEVACVSVSLDYSGRKSRPPELYREPVLTFLTEQEATFDNVLSTDDPDVLQQRLELPPIPLVWVFDRSGQRRMAFENSDRNGEEFTYAADIVPFVKTLVAEN